MAKTRHIQQRMSQRCIGQELIDLICQFGESIGDKRILNRKACQVAMNELDKLRKSLLRAEQRGGLVLVEDRDVQITAYSLDSYKRNKY